jgi:predicted membrane GTPase involved in stress response
MFVKPGDDVYKGMIVGIHQRGGDLEVNVCKAKALNNIRYESLMDDMTGQIDANACLLFISTQIGHENHHNWNRCPC